MDCVLRRLSPTALSLFENASDRFVFYYVLRVPRAPQTRPMAAGSTFDVHVKAAIMRDLLGKPESEVNDWFEGLYEKSLELAHKRWAKPIGVHLLENYKKSGCYKSLLLELEGATNIQMETKSNGVIKCADGFEIPIGGRPDLFFVAKSGILVIIDWKVSGFMTKASPKAGYTKLIEGAANYDRGPHRDVTPMLHRGVWVGRGRAMNKVWATQLTMYSWMEALVEDEVILGIDQIAVKNNSGKYTSMDEQTMRFATYRNIIREEFKANLVQRLRTCWEAVQARHYFINMTKEESDARVDLLANADDEMLWALKQKKEKL